MSKEKVQISPTQLTFLFIIIVISTADIFIPSFVAQEARQDCWISAILSTLAIMPVMFIYIMLYKNHSGKSLIEMCTEIAGKFAGKIIAFMYVFYFIFIAFSATQGLAAILNITFLQLTPPWVIVVISVAVSLYAVSQDLEVIARVSEILLPAGIGALVFLLLLNINEYDFNFFRPVLAEGIVQPVRGSIIILGTYCENVVILQIIKFISNTEKINRVIFTGMLVTGAGILAGTLIYAIFGPLTGILLLPSLEFARFSSIGKYIQNLDIIILAIWITGIYIKIIIFYYSGAFAMSQLFGLKNYKAIILPLGILLSTLVICNTRDEPEELFFMHYIYPFYTITMAIVIPGILLIISTIKKRIKGEKQK